MSIMINRNLQGKPAIIYGDGLQTRCFSYVDDCIQCLEKMALDSAIVSQVINIGPDEGVVTIKEMAELVAQECGLTEPPIYMLDRPREVKHATCSADKARQLLNYSTTTDLKTAIKRTADYIRAAGTKPFDYSLPLEIVNSITPETWAKKLI
jgi:UDP-glucose 4-epimerase